MNYGASGNNPPKSCQHPNRRGGSCQTLEIVVLSGLLVQWPKSVLRSLLAANLPLFSRRLQLPIPLGVDLLLTPGRACPSARCSRSLPVYRASVASSCVRSIILMGERLL